MEFTQKDVEELQEEVKKYTQEKKNDCEVIKTVREELLTSERKIKELEKRVNYQEYCSWRNNLQIDELQKRHRGESREQTVAQVTKLFEDEHQLPSNPT